MKLIPGTALYVPDSDTHFFDQGGLAATYQHDRVDAALQFCRKRRLAIDVGAHVGLLTLKLAQYFDHVIAYEPNPESFECLKANTVKALNVACYNLACGNRTGHVSVMPGAPCNTGDYQIDDLTAGDIEIAPLSELKLEHLDLLKLDVQGYEYYVLDGMRDTLWYCRPVCIVEQEPTSKLARAYEHTSKQGLGILKRLGATCSQTVGCDQIWAFPEEENIRFDKYEETGAYHWDKYTEAQSIIARVDEVAAYVRSQGHKSILDVGCGDGLYTAKMGEAAYGIDNNATAIKLAKEHDVKCRQLSVLHVEELGRQFDAVCLFDVLEHLFEQATVIQTLGKVTDTIYILNPEPDESHPGGYHTREFVSHDLARFMDKLGWNLAHSVVYAKSRRNNKTLMHFRKK